MSGFLSVNLYNMKKSGDQGFTLMEILVVIAIVGLLAAIAFVALGRTTRSARDAKRKSDLAQIGRFLSASACYIPAAGTGDYDIMSLIDELKARYPQYANYVSQVPKDPRLGTAIISGYRYQVSADGTKCALYASLEKDNEPVTLPSLTAPTPGGGTGVLKAGQIGPNGTDRYFQSGK